MHPAYDGSVITILEDIRATAKLEGVAVLDLGAGADRHPVLYSVGTTEPEIISMGRLLMTGQPGRPTHLTGRDGRPLLACPWIMPPSRPGGLLLWRSSRSPGWTQADHGLAASVAALLRTTIGSAFGEIGIDRLTGLPNRRWFLDEADRRADRLDYDGLVASLSLIDIDDLDRINEAEGRAQGDRALIRLASLLRAMVRPGDLVARVGADEFAIWQDGMDHLTAAERAEALCAGQFFRGGTDDPRIGLSIGIVSRPTGSIDDVRSLLQRAGQAAREVKSRGGGGWRVAHARHWPGCSDQIE